MPGAGRTLRSWARRVVPGPVLRRLRGVDSGVGPTVSEGWEDYARAFDAGPGDTLGDEWNEPEKMGIDAPASEVVRALDERVFQPFLGTCDVMLEIGPGAGRFTTVLLPKCRRLIAADTSPTMLKLLEQRFVSTGKVELLELDGTGLGPVADHSVDAAFSYGVFVHLQHWDFYHYLEELRRVLRPGGKAVLQHANTFSELGWLRFTSEDLPRQLNQHKLPWTFTVMTPDMMGELCRRAGLELVDCVTDVVRRDAISLLRA